MTDYLNSSFEAEKRWRWRKRKRFICIKLPKGNKHVHSHSQSGVGTLLLGTGDVQMYLCTLCLVTSERVSMRKKEYSSSCRNKGHWPDVPLWSQCTIMVGSLFLAGGWTRGICTVALIHDDTCSVV